MGRRPNGSGTVYPSRGTGRRLTWCAVVVTGWSPQGRPIRVSRWCATRREAEAKREAMANALRETGVLPDDRVAVTAYLEGWLRTRGDLRPGSLRTYRHAISHLDARLGWHRLATLRPTTIEAALREMPPQTARLARSVLSAAYRDALRDGLASRNPVALSRTVRAQTRSQRVPTVADVRALLAAKLPTRDRAILAVGLTTSLRAGELCGLRWPDVVGDRLTVSRQLVATATGWVEGPPKTASSARVVPLLPVAIAALDRWKREQATIGGYVFGVTPRTLRHLVDLACKTAGVERFPPHSMRRFVAQVLERDPKAAAATLGHTSARETLDTYTRTTDETRRRAAEIIGEAIG